MSKLLKIGIVALLKPSQVHYKISPLLMSSRVEEVILFRKKRYSSENPKLTQYVLPSFMNYKCFYWTLTPFFIACKLRKHRVDLLLTYRFIPHTYYTWVVAKLLRKPFIYSQIDLDVVSLHKNMVGKIFVEYILREAAQINVPGTSSLDYWRQYFKTSRINIIHSTINTDDFKPVKSDAIYDFMYVGVLTETKRIELLVQAVENMMLMGMSIRLAIIGYGHLEVKLRTYVMEKRLTDNVLFLGKREVDSNLLCLTKIFVMSSQSEGLPCALMEAMACERLCLSTNVGNIADVIIDGETGFLFKLPDPISMSLLMKDAIENYDKYRHIRERGRMHIINNHSFLSATQKWERVFDGF